MEIPHLIIQMKRLIRHRDRAKKDNDEISFLDLTHCLRIWVDMKKEVQILFESNNVTPSFKNKKVDRRISDLLKNSNYILIPIPFSPNTLSGGMANIIISKNEWTAEQAKKYHELGPPSSIKTNLSFSQWLNSEIIEVRSNKNTPKNRLGIQREMLIKRVANFLGASHPEGMESSKDYENRFDPNIRELHEVFVLDGIRLTYYQLLEIADQIIENLSPLLLKY